MLKVGENSILIGMEMDFTRRKNRVKILKEKWKTKIKTKYLVLVKISRY